MNNPIWCLPINSSGFNMKDNSICFNYIEYPMNVEQIIWTEQ